MGFYIEELPTELNGITMKEAVYWADIYLQDNPCDRMWDAIRALRDFYETVTSEAVEVADRKTEPTISKMEQVEEPIDRDDLGNCNICKYVGLEHRCNQCVNGSMFCKVEDEPQTERIRKCIDCRLVSECRYTNPDSVICERFWQKERSE